MIIRKFGIGAMLLASCTATDPSAASQPPVSDHIDATPATPADRATTTAPPASTRSTLQPPPVAPAELPVDLQDVAGRAAHSATSLSDGSVLIAGGCVVDGCSTATDDVFIVAADGQSVVKFAAMSTARDVHSATLLADGTVVLAGGFPGEGQRPTPSIDLIDPAAGTTTATAMLATGRGGHAAALTEGEVYMIGGWIRSRTYASSVEIFDPATGAVRPGSDLPYSADSLEAATLRDGRILVTGGQTSPAVGTDRAAVLDPDSGEWAEVGPMTTARFKHSMVVLDDGRVLVIGGTPDDDELLASTEIFDPITGTFVSGPDLAESRYKMPNGSVLMDDGRIAIGGGGRTVEILDLESGQSTVVERFAERGSFATVNLIADDQLLVLGGYDDRITLRDEVRIVDLTA